MVSEMRVEVLYWDGCPSYPRALADLREMMAELGLELTEIGMQEITSDADAKLNRSIGSPTIRIDGVDLVPSTSEAYGLTCRIYRHRDGRISPTPDPADMRDALTISMSRGAEHA
jgi:hypothetical protein